MKARKDLTSIGRYYRDNPEKFNNPKEKSKRRKRNKARRLLLKELGPKALKGKEVDHIKPLGKGGSNTRANLRVISEMANRTRKKS
jgi:5-methylcytosine-specific restriction endonuclease McrA